MIFFEGVDGSGKTTLLTHLKNEYGYINNFKTPDRYPDKSKERQLWEYAETESFNFSMSDRGPLSELVYRKMDGKKSWIPNFSYFCNFMKGHLIIYCETPTSFEDAKKRGETNVVTKELHDKIKLEYEKLITVLNEYSDTAVVCYNWKLMDELSVVKVINTYITGGVDAVRQLCNS